MIEAIDVIRINESEMRNIYFYLCHPTAAVLSESTCIKSY
jgi:hypothetical protein